LQASVVLSSASVSVLSSASVSVKSSMAMATDRFSPTALDQRREPVERAPTDGNVPGCDDRYLDDNAATVGLAGVAVDAGSRSQGSRRSASPSVARCTRSRGTGATRRRRGPARRSGRHVPIAAFDCVDSRPQSGHVWVSRSARRRPPARPRHRDPRRASLPRGRPSTPIRRHTSDIETCVRFVAETRPISHDPFNGPVAVKPTYINSLYGIRTHYLFPRRVNTGIRYPAPRWQTIATPRKDVSHRAPNDLGERSLGTRTDPSQKRKKKRSSANSISEYWRSH